MRPTDFQLLVLLAQGPQTMHNVAETFGQSTVWAWYRLFQLEAQGLARRCSATDSLTRWELVRAAD